MDVWLIFNKLFILLFIMFKLVQSKEENLSWVVFALLLYVCINLAVYIVKNTKAIQAGHVLSLLVAAGAAHEVHPSIIFLLPVNQFELLSYYTEKKWPLLLGAAIPILFLHSSIWVDYGFIAGVSFLFFEGMCTAAEKLRIYDQELDAKRAALQKMTKNMNDSNEFLKQSQYTVKLEERNRISQEIHDNIGHAMTGALIQMEASKRLIATDQTKAVELLQNAIHISKEGIEKIRLTLKDMKPPVEQMGIHRIKLLLDEFAAKNDVQTVFVHKGNIDLITPIQWKVIHENVYEALTNMLKYSRGTAVSIDLNVLNKFIRFEVKDNGKGAEKVKKGLGIMGMEERTAAVKGTIIVDGSSGFSVTTLLPLE
ncbi:sensor histidine kinase [Falsibacillus pallidus]|uniref:histidine kinase n=1 Tax=Falsibacillus pallidus TaxID=493781 RepID=A0A370GGC0_9BACI|nr:sensor histidine kinase [Falsibacillus pallidus]RDI41013.1 signal transduction histidine kinase [Falsibacillus pallidus]